MEIRTSAAAGLASVQRLRDSRTAHRAGPENSPRSVGLSGQREEQLAAGAGGQFRVTLRLPV